MILEWILLIASIVTGIFVFKGKKKQLADGASVWVDYSRSLFPVIIIVFALRSFIVEPFRIPSSSMLPTLHVGDFILVNKMSYGIRLPIVYTKIIPTGEPERGDVAVFRYPEDTQINFIKRVVGLPGDEIEVRGKRVFINGKQIEMTVIDEAFNDPIGGGGFNVSRLQETLGETEHDLLINTRRGSKSFKGVVPEDHYFVLGDNRDNSRDSRFWGYVPEGNLVGRAFLIWFNLTSDNGIEWNRIGESIH